MERMHPPSSAELFLLYFFHPAAPFVLPEHCLFTPHFRLRSGSAISLCSQLEPYLLKDKYIRL